jgi:hypothetical protein
VTPIKGRHAPASLNQKTNFMGSFALSDGSHKVTKVINRVTLVTTTGKKSHLNPACSYVKPPNYALNMDILCPYMLFMDQWRGKQRWCGKGECGEAGEL